MTSFLTPHEPPPKRRKAADGGIEQRLTEAAVMLAFAFHLLEQPDASDVVHVHPDGEHAKIFDIVDFLRLAGFDLSESLGSTKYGGRYVKGRQMIVVRPSSGQGDVVGEVAGRRVIAECKGGVVNSSHSGQKSRLRKGLSELIGQLMVLPEDGARQVAVIPSTRDTSHLAHRLAGRCRKAGIELALVDATGSISYVTPS